MTLTCVALIEHTKSNGYITKLLESNIFVWHKCKKNTICKKKDQNVLLTAQEIFWFKL